MDPDASYSDLSALDRVQRAEGSFSKKVLTQKNGRLNDQRVVDYLDADEHLAFVLYHHQKGLRITQPDGSEQTPHHRSLSDPTVGSRYLLVTDRRICYLAGLDSHDEVRNFDYAQLTDVVVESKLFSRQIAFTTADGTEYRFADSGHHSQDIQSAAQYIQDRIGTETADTRSTEENGSNTPDTMVAGDESSTPARINIFPIGTGILAILSSVVLSGILFAVVASVGFSFPVLALDAVTYGQNMTTPLWGGFIGSCSLGAATATTIWYPLRADQQFREEMPSAMTVFTSTFLTGFALFGLVGFLRLILTIILLLVVLLLTLVGPLLFLYGLVKMDGTVVLSSLVLLVFWILVFLVTGDYGTPVQANIYALITITTLTAALPPTAGHLAADDAITAAREQQSELAELDTVLQEIDHDYLRSLGLELPYHRAGVNIESTNSQVVFDNPARGQDLTYLTDFYRVVVRLEQELSASSDIPGEPTTVMSQLCELLNDHTPETDVEKHHRSLFERAIDILEAYQVLQKHDNQDAISELEDRLQSVTGNGTNQDGSSTQELSSVLDELEDIEWWLTDRARASVLAARQTAILNEWEQTVIPVFGSEINAIRPLQENIESSDRSLTDIEVQLSDAERIISLATTVKKFKTETDSSVVEQTIEAVREFLIEAAQSTQGLAESVVLLQDGIRVIQLSLEKDVEYPGMPFDDLVKQIVAAIEEASITSQTIADAEQVISDVETILSFLETVDSSHPSVPTDGWRDSIDTALKNNSTEVLNPEIKMIERMGDTLWEYKHLQMFSWYEFEHLIGSLYEKQGYETNVTQQGSDEGVDIWASNEGVRVAIQVKQFSSENKVGRPDVQKLASTIAKGDADRAIIVTSSGFTQPAKTYAADFGQKMELVDGDDLIRMLSESEIPPPV